jgi:hypothetical protein
MDAALGVNTGVGSESAQAVPLVVNLAKSKPPAISAYVRKVYSLASNALTYTENGVVQIMIDTSTPGSFIDPHSTYLEFDLTVAGTNDTVNGNLPSQYYWNSAGYSCIIEEMRVLCQNVIVEEIRAYNLLVSYLNDVHGQSTVEPTGESAYPRESQGLPSYNLGTGWGTLAANNWVQQYDAIAAAANVATNLHTQTYIYDQVGRVDTTTSCQMANFGVANLTYRCQIPLVSGVIGTLAEKYFPTMLISPGTLMLELRLATTARAFMVGKRISTSNNTITGYTITNVRLVQKQIIVQDAIASTLIAKATKGDLGIQTTSFRNLTQTIPNSQCSGSSNLIISTRISSCDAIIGIFRDSDILDDITLNSFLRSPIGMNAKGTGASYQLRIGNEFVPQTEIQSSNDSFIELLRAHHMFGDLVAQTFPIMGKIGWFQDHQNGVVSDFDTALIYYGYWTEGALEDPDSLTPSQFGSTFAVAIDLDTFTGSNDVIRSGRYLGNNTIFLILNNIAIPAYNQYPFYAATGIANPGAPASGARVDIFAMHGARLSIGGSGQMLFAY